MAVPSAQSCADELSKVLPRLLQCLVFCIAGATSRAFEKRRQSTPMRSAKL